MTRIPNVIKFSGDNNLSTLKIGNFHLGISTTFVYSPTVNTNFWNGYTPPSNGFTIFQQKNLQGPSIYAPQNDEDLLNYVKDICTPPLTFTSATEFIIWLREQPDKAIINFDYPEIPTTGLISVTDDYFTPSYPRSGDTIYDVSENNYNVNVIGSPTWYSGSSGGFYYTSGSYSQFSTNTLPKSAYTKCAWFYLESYQNNILSGGNSGGEHAFWLQSSNTLRAGHNGNWSTVQSVTQLDLGKWYFGSVSFSQSSGWKLYLDGNLEDTNTGSTTTFNGPNPGLINIGAYDDSNFFDGRIPVTLIYDRVLTDSEISKIYSEYLPRFMVATMTPTPTLTITPTPTITPTTTITPSITPTNTPTNTITPSLTPTITPTNTPTNTITPSITSSITPTNTPTNTITPSITPSITSTPAAASPTPTPSITTTITPTRTTTPTPTLTQTPTPTKLNGGSIAFVPSNNEYLSLAGSSDWAVGTGDFTIEGFIYQTNNGNENYIMSLGSSDTFAVSIASGGNRLNCYLGGSRVANPNITSSTNAWYYWAITRSSGTLNIYHGNTRIATQANSTNVTDSASSLYIGVGNPATPTGDNWPGNMTNFRFIKGAALYTGATITIPTSPLVADANTKLLLAAKTSGTFTDDTSLSPKVVTNNGTTWSALTPF